MSKVEAGIRCLLLEKNITIVRRQIENRDWVGSSHYFPNWMKNLYTTHKENLFIEGNKITMYLYLQNKKRTSHIICDRYETMNEDTGLKKSIGIIHSWRIFEFLFIRIHYEQRRSFSDCQFWNRYFLVLFLQTDFDVVAIKTRIHEFVSTRQMYISYRWIHHQTYTFKTLCNTNNIKLKKKKYISILFQSSPMK